MKNLVLQMCLLACVIFAFVGFNNQSMSLVQNLIIGCFGLALIALSVVAVFKSEEMDTMSDDILRLHRDNEEDTESYRDSVAKLTLEIKHLREYQEHLEGVIANNNWGLSANILRLSKYGIKCKIETDFDKAIEVSLYKYPHNTNKGKETMLTDSTAVVNDFIIDRVREFFPESKFNKELSKDSAVL